jgi:hypothetical protein
MSISQNFPNTRPSLNLNFARSKKLDPRITFTRSSTATYVDEDGLIKSAATNTPRFDHDPTTGDCLGLLIEESKTNLITYSEDYSINSFTSDILITTNTITAPDGNTTADTLTANINGGSNTCLVDKNFVSTVSTNYTYSVFLKAGTSPKSTANLYFTGGTFREARLEITWGATPSTTLTSTVGTTATSSLVAYPNGWYRAIITYNSGNNTGAVSRVYVRDFGTSNVSGETVYAWGHQVETGAFPTSYIPTVASTVTRSADSASITGTNFSSWYNPSEGTLFTNLRTLGYASGTFPRPFGFVEFADQFNDFWQVVYNGSTQTVFTETRVNAATPLGVTNQSLTSNTNIKIANAVKNGEGQFTSYNGQSIVSNLSSSSSSSINSIVFNYANHNGIISQLSYYPVRLSNAQLQTLTK